VHSPNAVIPCVDTTARFSAYRTYPSYRVSWTSKAYQLVSVCPPMTTSWANTESETSMRPYTFMGHKIEIKELEENGINIYNNESYY
jgi:hypothetical protein